MPRLTLNRPKRLLLVGDHMQLPPFTQCNGFVPVSMLERISSCCDVPMLKWQFRMHPDICALVSNEFYRRELMTAPETEETRRREGIGTQTVQWIHTRTDEQDNGHSKENRGEALEICSLLRRESWASVGTIAIITFYKAQADLLKNTLRENGHTLNDKKMTVMTVDSAQGRSAREVFCESVCESVGVSVSE